MESERAELSEAQQKLQGLKNEEARLQSRIDVLQSVMNEGSDANRYLKENKANLIGGLVSERIEATPEYASSVEAALGEILDSVVVNGDDAVNEIVNALKSENVGKVLMSLVSSAAPAYDKPVNNPGVVGSLKDFVKTDDEVSPWLSGILSRYFVVDSLQTALNLAKEYRGENLNFVTADTIVRTSGLVSFGVSTSGALSRKNEIADAEALLEKVLGDISAGISAGEENVDRLRELTEEDAQMLSSLVDEIREKRDSLRGGDASIRIHRNTVENCTRRLNQLNGEVTNAQNRIEAAAQSKNSDAELAEAETEVEKVEAEGDARRGACRAPGLCRIGVGIGLVDDDERLRRHFLNELSKARSPTSARGVQHVGAGSLGVVAPSAFPASRCQRPARCRRRVSQEGATLRMLEVRYSQKQALVLLAQRVATVATHLAELVVGVELAALVDDARHKAEGEGRVYAISAPVRHSAAKR